MAFVYEYSCSCMQHSMAGFIRRCQGQISRSLSGKQVSTDGGESKHNSAINAKPIRTYEVAEILP